MVYIFQPFHKNIALIPLKSDSVLVISLFVLRIHNNIHSFVHNFIYG